MLHHLELRTADLAGASEAWGWLLTELGYVSYQEWPLGRSWRHGSFYVVLESAPTNGAHDRRTPGLSHIAFHCGTTAQADRLWEQGPGHGWSHLYSDRHPFAGGTAHYAAFLENAERFKVELVADPSAR